MSRIVREVENCVIEGKQGRRVSMRGVRAVGVSAVIVAHDACRVSLGTRSKPQASVVQVVAVRIKLQPLLAMTVSGDETS